MFYQILLIMPYLVIASCIPLGLAVYAICTSKRILDDEGFVVYDRRKIRPSIQMRTSILPPVAPARQTVDIRA